MARRDPKVRDTKQKILDAALEVFGCTSLRVASIEDVALKAGVTKGAVYYYFEDKNDLAADLQAQLWANLAERALSKVQPDEPVIENIVICFEEFLAALQELPSARFFLREAWSMPALDATSRDDQDNAVALISGLLQTSVDRGELVLSTPDPLSRILVGALMEATHWVLSGGEVEPVRDVLRLLLDGFRAPKGALVTAGAK